MADIIRTPGTAAMATPPWLTRSDADRVRGRTRSRTCNPLPLPLPFLRGGWLHRRWPHPARRPQLGSNAQPQINRYGYVNLFEAFANLKRVLKRNCFNASEDIMGAPIMSLLISILAAPRRVTFNVMRFRPQFSAVLELFQSSSFNLLKTYATQTHKWIQWTRQARLKRSTYSCLK